MEIDKAVHITLSKEDLEQLLEGCSVYGDGYEISLSRWEFETYKYKWKLVKELKCDD